MKAFVVTTITRAHSSGDENRAIDCFATLEEASKAIQDYIQYLCKNYGWPEDWDASDFNGEPSPTIELATVERLRALLAESGGCEVVVWGPFSNFCYLVPDEILLTETK